MQEQPPSEQTKPESAEGARRRSPKATFTPPPTPPAQDSPGGSGVPRPRRAKAAPSVLFQPPPAPEQQPPPRPDSSAPPLAPAPPFAVGSADADDHPDARTDPAPDSPPDDIASQPSPGGRVADTTPQPTPDSRADDITPQPAPPARKKVAAKPRKSAAKKTAPKKAGVDEAEINAGPVTSRAGSGDTAKGTAEAELRSLAVRVLDHPGFAPELLALTAVEALGPVADEWARRLRETYPRADGDGLARLATRRFVRQAAVGGVGAALAGAFAPVVELAAVLWSQANLVLHVAAAYERDPAHPERAAELLVLAQVHPDLASARSALAAARTIDGPGEPPGPRAVEAAWRLAAPLTAQAGGWLALRLASRLLPGAAVLAAAAGGSAAAERLAARAVAAYRPPGPLQARGRVRAR
ncbi:hypothetical protein Vqi01_52790 [Micromonospora qiuiae]|uniref:EcsC family protein n=1 Tax=Micromonospora qiuiae TaxID=502268 RepID=A0ABQ4JKP0_9ACTN|nr:hypothetical protein [Micromonospora qiuiae]GIJ30117.1 hypothetical protein Vqi01_52790 [Micromonospora qiuiae]